MSDSRTSGPIVERLVNLEKAPLVPHSGPGRARRSALTVFREQWIDVLRMFLALIVLWFVAHTYTAFLFHSTSESSPSQPTCPQVPPLTPNHTTPALSALALFLESRAFAHQSVARLSGAVQIPSISYDDLGPIGSDPRWDVFYDFAAYLERTFPLVHAHLELTKVNTHGLLYTWRGSDSTLKPTVLMAHQDVVPVPPSTVPQWTHPPFSGHFDGSYIWGRGSSDCKNSLIGILSAVEGLLHADFVPRRSVLLAFGFDEEVSGPQGARHLAQHLLEVYGKDSMAAIVDEGSAVYTLWGSVFAAPGVAEKGYLDVDIEVRMPGGHSSVPPAHNGIGVMSELVTLIEANRYEPHLVAENPYYSLLQCGAEHATEFPGNLAKLLPKSEGNPGQKKLDRLAREAAKQSLKVRYLMTTAVAVDVISGGIKVNALPELTVAAVNHRINVGETRAVVKARLTQLSQRVAHKYNLTLDAFPSSSSSSSSSTTAHADSLLPPSPRHPDNSITLRARPGDLDPAPVTPTDTRPGSAYAVVAGTTRALYDAQGVLVAPGIMTGNTDTRHYWALSRNIFRYAPGWDPDQEGFGNIHTVDEKIGLVAHVRTVRWYVAFLRNMDEAVVD